MPIYEYQCESCGHRKDALQKISDAPLTDCPACGRPELRKLVSAPRFRLKGSGWYETDFKTDNKRNLADGGDKPATAAGADKSDKSDKADAGKTSGTDKAAGEAKPAKAASGSSGSGGGAKKASNE
jgi:putative FmdB family regulatory protein